MSKLLIDEPPLQVLPSLAKKIGLNEAIVVQQVHYWLSGKSGKTFDGRRWVYNSYCEWAKQLPFWSEDTIARAFVSAEKQGILLSRQASGFDRRKWYTIDYDALDRNLQSSMTAFCGDAQPQNAVVPSPQNAVVLTEKENIAENIGCDVSNPTDGGASDFSKLVKTYEDNINLITPIMAEELRDALTMYPLDWCTDAIKETVKAGVRSWNYAASILSRWKKDGRNSKRAKTQEPTRRTPRIIGGQNATSN